MGVAIFHLSLTTNTNLPWVPKNICTKFHQYISTFAQVIACRDGQMNSHSEFNLIICTYTYIHNSIFSRLVLGVTINR